MVPWMVVERPPGQAWIWQARPVHGRPPPLPELIMIPDDEVPL